MKKYKIIFGSGLAQAHERTIEVEDYEYEQDAIDHLIDELEEEGAFGLVVSISEIEKEEYGEDMYIIGGNHSLCLLHYGTLIIKEEV